MSTFMLKNSATNFTPVSNIFIDQYIPKARGEFVKVYLIMLKYSISGELGVNSSILAAKLNLLESDIMNALTYWNDEGAIKLTTIDSMNNFNVEFLDLVEPQESKKSNIDLLSALNQNNTKDMLRDIEMLIGRTLSPVEMSTYLSWQTDFGFSSELILILIEYCASKGKRDARYIEKVAIAWHDAGIKNMEDAQEYITKSEDKWVKIKKILNYLGIKNTDIMKPQEELLSKWLLTYNFSLDVIFKACDICFERLNRADFKYIDGILSKWFKDGLKTLQDISSKDVKKPNSTSPTQRASVPQNNKFNYNNQKSLKFTNYSQRDYDYDSLEKQLLGWDKE